RKLLPIYQEGAVDEDLLQEGRRNLRDYLQAEGYFDADVNYSSSTQPSQGEARTGVGQDSAATSGSETITYSIDRGARHRLADVAFAGNHYFDNELLRSRLQIQRAGFAFPGKFSTGLVTADTQSLTALYQANGFMQAKVANEVDDNYKGRRGDLLVRFRI